MNKEKRGKVEKTMNIIVRKATEADKDKLKTIPHGDAKCQSSTGITNFGRGAKNL